MACYNEACYNVVELYVPVLFSRNVAFFAGSILAVLVVLTVIDEDVLNVEHVFTIATIAGNLIIMLFKSTSFIDENVNNWVKQFHIFLKYTICNAVYDSI